MTKASDKNKSRVQSLLKGLHVIELLNTYPGLNANKVADLSSISRGSTYRILETLCEAGYINKDKSSGTYWLDGKILSLSSGLHVETWVWQLAKPIMNELGEKFVWPISLVTAKGTNMIVRTATDKDSPLTARNLAIGAELPMVTSAGGLVYLAFCSRNKRTHLVDLSITLHGEEGIAEVAKSPTLTKELSTIRKQGYALQDVDKGISVLAVPILSSKGVFASLAIRYFTSALRPKDSIRKFLKELQSGARRIGNAYDGALPEQEGV